MQYPRLIATLAIAGFLGLTACERSVTPPPISEGMSLSVVSGDQQSGAAGAELSAPLVVKVTKANGSPVSGQVVNFRVVSGGGSIFAGTAITDSRGIAQERWTLGAEGPQTVEARAVSNTTGAPLVFATFNATVAGCSDCWTTKASMRQSRYGLTLAALNGKLYAVGGETVDSERTVQLVEVYDPTSDTWSAGPPTPTSRAGAGSAVIGGVLYVVGGYCCNHNDKSAVTTLEAYDPATNTWTTKASMPTARTFLAVAVVNGILYAIGGSGGYGQPITDVVEAYNPSTNRWSTKAPLPLGAQQGGAAAASGGAIYVIGGFDASGSILRDVQRYDPSTNAWSIVAPISVGRSFLGAAELNGRIYAIGGFDSTFSFSAQNESYNPGTNTWTTKAAMAIPRNQLGVAALNGVVYAAGGASDAGQAGESVLEVYRP